ncbi:thioredoxin family protein [Qipengyuania sp.]|uniref:protein-disulfide reductase DsbD family protein n=1 Tax=Qipengyuania sp. TaxID=2004515 RepID=UPI003510F3F4
MAIVYRFIVVLAVLLTSVTGVAAGSAQAQDRRKIEPSLAFETRSPGPGEAVTVAIRMRPERGWHGYWSNPGEAGLPVTAKWQAPEGVTFTGLRHPAPQLLDVQGIASYVHHGPFTLLTTMRVPETLARGTAIPISVALDWLVCSDTLCVPERATLSAELVVGDGARDKAGAQVVAAGRSALPQTVGGASYRRAGSDWIFSLPIRASASAHLFPADDGWFASDAPQKVSNAGGRTLVRVPAAGEAPRSTFNGVVSARGGTSYAISARRGEVAPVGEPAPSATVSEPAAQEQIPAGEAAAIQAPNKVVPAVDPASEGGPDTPSTSVIRVALMGALIGGLLLNLMPCVFPILSLKALSLAKSGASSQAAKLEGLGYAAGTIFTAVALGALLIGLRALGMEIGWSFQLQSPGIILVLIVLTAAIALNLAGLFELPVPAFVAGSTHRGGWLGGFSTGALAAVIGMPCSGPFMAGALGAALVLPAAAALGVFAMLGFGMALPFLVIALVPAARRRLPKPGAWMNTLRKVLSIPMFATALALVWILGRQTGVDGMALGLAVATLFAISFWWFGSRQRRGQRGWAAFVPAMVALAALLGYGFPAPPATAAADVARTAGHEPFSAARLAQLRSEGKPVFVDFTADWCLVCKVNERVAIDTDATRAAFAKSGVVTLTGDWTRQDPEITRFLASHGRNSIPFYLFYMPGEEAEILPQVLTPQTLQDKATQAFASPRG